MEKATPIIRVVPEQKGSGTARVIFTQAAWSLLTGGNPVTNIRADVRDTLLCLSLTDKPRPESELDFAARILTLKEYESVAVANFWGQHDYVLTDQKTGVFTADLSDPLPESKLPDGPSVQVILNYPADQFPSDDFAIRFPEECSVTLKFSGKISRLLKATYIYPMVENNQAIFAPHWKDGWGLATNLPSCGLEITSKEKVEALIPYRGQTFPLLFDKRGRGYIQLEPPEDLEP